MDSSKKVAQEIAKKLRSYEESVAKKQLEPDTSRIDELSMQQERNPTVSQLLIQIQDVTEQGEFLGGREFNDLETGSSGASHVRPLFRVENHA